MRVACFRVICRRMVKIPTELRQKLIESERWADFVACCERLEDEGKRGTELRDDAIDEVCPDMAEFKRRKRVKKSERREDWCGVTMADRGESKASDRRCNIYRLLEWVVENLRNANVTADDAPSVAAYNILMECRENDDQRQDVVKKYIDSRVKLDNSQGDTDTRKMDGQAEYDILDGLQTEGWA